MIVKTKCDFLITGYSGFVGKFFLDFLDNIGETINVVCISRKSVTDENHYKNLKITVEAADLNNRLKIQDILYYYQPQYILHLAAYSSVAYSWKYPIESFNNNTNIFLNLLESIRILKIPCRLLSVGSSEEYGIVKPNDIPLNENTLLNPISPYAVARVSQEMLSKLYVESYDLDIVMTRSFNHCGPEQTDQFVISSLTRKILMYRTKYENKILTGDLTIIRDFLDVRDVVRAYYLLLVKGIKGEVYNVCSGTGYSIGQILEKLCKLVGITCPIDIDQKLIRPNDNPIIIGNNEKLISCTHWNIQYSIDDSLSDIVKFWKIKLRNEGII